jgi:hypothetical protein
MVSILIFLVQNKFRNKPYVTSPVYIFQYIFFLSLEVIQLKLLKDSAQISLAAYGDCFADADKRRIKNKCKKTFTCFLVTYNCCAVTVIYNDKGGREKRGSYGRY